MNKKEIRKSCNYVSGGILLYTVVFFLTIIVWYSVKAIGIYIRVKDEAKADKMAEAMFEHCEQDGGSIIFAILCGLVILLLFFRKSVSLQEIFVKNNEMTKVKFTRLMCVFMGTQLVFSAIGIVLEEVFNLFGYSLLGCIEDAAMISETWSMLLYASFLGPIVEELIYRGFVLRSFMKFGKMPAIIFSSILFGVMHANIYQILFAGVVGLILGYVAVEYSIRYTILLHIINNFVFGDLLSYLIRNFSETTQEIINGIVLFGFFFVAVIIIWKKRKEIKEYLIANRTKEKFYRYLFTSVMFLLFIAFNLALGISMIERL